MRPDVARFARAPVLSAVAALIVVLAASATRYGYHRDELYFRMLPAAWGYLDQPPFTPAVARLTMLIADQTWALRLPSMIFAGGSVVVVALITAELGGGRLAQGLAAWGSAFATMTLSFGHLLLTTSVDLVCWPLITLAVIKAVRRHGVPEMSARWWRVAGVVIGASTYNKWLVIMLVASIVGGMLIAGPRRLLISRSVLGGAVLAVVIAAPNLVWQATHGFPQRAVGAAVAARNADEVRITAVALLPVMIGPLLFAVVVAGFVALVRRSTLRPVRFLAPASVIMVGLTVAAGAQFYYSFGLVVVIFAVGCVPAAEFADRGSGRRRALVGLTAAHVISNVVINLPMLPPPVLARTVIPDLNPAVGDQIGWPAYVAQIDRAVDQGRISDPGTIVLTSNYGEAGAMSRFSRHREVAVYSGHNALGMLAAPPASATTVVVVGGQYPGVQALFERCSVVGHLDNGIDFDNEEQGEPVAICVGPTRPWTELWPQLRHLG